MSLREKRSRDVGGIDVVDGLKNHLTPNIKNGALDRAQTFTEVTIDLFAARDIAVNFEAHAGFGRNYPGSPMIDEDFKLTEKEEAALKKMRKAKPFRGSAQDYVNIIQQVYIDLAEAHNSIPPLYRHDGKFDGSSKRSSFYTPHAVFATGPRSVVVSLHEYIHSLGYGEVVAVWWSTNAFRLMYPKSYERLKLSKINPHLMRKNLDPELEADQDYVTRKNIADFHEFMDERDKFVEEYIKKQALMEAVIAEANVDELDTLEELVANDE